MPNYMTNNVISQTFFILRHPDFEFYLISFSQPELMITTPVNIKYSRLMPAEIFLVAGRGFEPLTSGL